MTSERLQKEFIAFDGEGIQRDDHPDLVEVHNSKMFRNQYYGVTFDYHRLPQPYVLLANSKGQKIISDDPEGLHTKECIEFLLEAKRQYPHSIFVGFGMNYDWNQMLRDLPTNKLQELYDRNWTKWGTYWIRMIPGKEFTVTERKTKRSALMYDVLGFFQSSFLEACRKYIGTDDPNLKIIAEGKSARAVFRRDELDEFIIPYNDMELALLVRLMDIVRQDFEGVGIHPRRWHGPGAVANEVLNLNSVPTSRTIPREVLDASQYAYAGGRAEQFWMGHHADGIYQYDIRSAYPAAATNLPDISAGHWEHTKTFEPGTFGVWYIEYQATNGIGRSSLRPQPLFCRAQSGYIGFPLKVNGWYWTPEAELVPDCVQGGFVFRPSSESRPFAFIAEMYDQRRVLKAQGNSTERALKLILNSLYGKMAQQVGGDDSTPPRWHQLEYAGYITSYTRAKIYRAIQLDPDAIIGAETDAVFSISPLDLPLSPNLGDWDKTEYQSITYMQTGFYYITDLNGVTTCKYRGLDKDLLTGQPVGLSHERVLKHYNTWPKGCRNVPDDRPGGFRAIPLTSTTRRFIGLGLALHTDSVWRSWEVKERVVKIDYNPAVTKRFHLSEICPDCLAGRSMADQLHPLNIGGYSGDSYAKKLPWRNMKLEELPVEEVTNYQFYSIEEYMRWQ